DRARDLLRRAEDGIARISRLTAVLRPEVPDDQSSAAQNQCPVPPLHRLAPLTGRKAESLAGSEPRTCISSVPTTWPVGPAMAGTLAAETPNALATCCVARGVRAAMQMFAPESTA